MLANERTLLKKKRKKKKRSPLSLFMENEERVDTFWKVAIVETLWLSDLYFVDY